jgi:Holliday junction DNA helicase RuvA
LITSVEGTLAGSGVGWVDVSVGGVTLRASMPESAVEEIGGLGERVRIFTYLNVRDDNITLFGFPTEEARSAFEALITVSGVGPRIALAILSALSTEALAAAIDGSDPSAFKAASGVGTKTANRILLELKGKLDWEPVAQSGGDLVSALTALGYTVAEIRAATSSLPRDPSMTLEDQVRYSIEQMTAEEGAR